MRSLAICLALGATATLANADTLISEVSLNPRDFNPAADERVALSFALSRPDAVTVRVFDPDEGLVRTLEEAQKRDEGVQRIEWDGRDDSGAPAPDEAYTFVIETASGAVFDPFATSGGVVTDIRDAKFDETSGTVVYSLPESARTLIRLGIKNGPMLKTLVDWKPRVAGSVTEYWDGWDEGHLVSLRELEGFTALITYVTLPEATVVAYGNKAESYRDYKLGRGADRPLKTPRERQPDARNRLAPDNLVPEAWTRAFEVEIAFPRLGEFADQGIPAIADAVAVRVDVDAADKDYLFGNQFEVILYVDNVFHAEAERGYVPFNWNWELDGLSEGEHLLTVNISSFAGQVGVASRRIRVSRP